MPNLFNLKIPFYMGGFMEILNYTILAITTIVSVLARILLIFTALKLLKALDIYIKKNQDK